MSHDENSQVPAVAQPTGDLLGAIARGWCATENAGKEMDSDLAFAIGREVTAYLASQSQAAQPSQRTDLSKRLREAATAEVSFADAKLLIGAAEEIERYYGGMMAWKQTAEKKDRDWNAERMGRVNDRIAGQSQATRAVPVAWMNPNEGCSMDAFLWQKDPANPQYSQPVYAAPTAQEVTQQAAKAEPFPERDPSKPAAQQGLYRKFNVERTDGQSRPGNKHYGCRYYVLDLTHDQHAPAAMRAYAAACRSTHPQLAADIEAEFGAQAAPEEVRNQALEEVAKLIEQKVYAYTDECGIYDHTTGVTEYPGNGEEWVGEMGELVEEIRALKRTTSGKGEAA